MDAPRERGDFLGPIEPQREYLHHQLGQSQKLTVPIGPEAVQALLQGTNPLPSTKARQKFIDFICDRANRVIFCEDKGKGISTKAFFGHEGTKLYQKALDEEAKDPAFRVAAFEASVLKVEKRKFDRKLVGYIAGPSGSGKSVATTAFLEKLPDYIPNKPSEEDSHFVQIDGGIIRKESSMRKLVIRAANLHGYHDISDLHSKSRVLDEVKDAVEAAANVDPDLNLLKPETFSYWSVPLNDTQDNFKKMVSDPKIETVICKVEGATEDFSDVVEFMGKNRASMTTGFENMNVQSLDLHNQKDLKESKAYDYMGFYFGENGSNNAEQAYIDIRKKQGKPVYTFTVKNDLILLKPKGNQWIPAKSDDKNVIMLSQRTYDQWKALPEPKEPLPAYADKNRAPAMITSQQAPLLPPRKAAEPSNEALLEDGAPSRQPPVPVPDTVPEKPSKEVIEPARGSPEQSTQLLKQRLKDLKKASAEENAAKLEEESTIPQIPTNRG